MPRKRRAAPAPRRVRAAPAAASPSATLLRELRRAIAGARERVAHQVNEELVALYWAVGIRIRRDLLGKRRAAYGQQILQALGAQLGAEFGDGFSTKNLWHMVRFAEVFPDERIVSALRRQLTWTHFKRLVYLDDPLQRDFYAEMCRVERWSTRTLQQKIGSMLFERTALSRKPAALVRQELDALRQDGTMTPDLVFRDPYLLGFLGLDPRRDAFLEKDLENAIVRELERFLLELGVGFAFVARQKRIPVDGDDYYLDLLFFHRGLRRLVAVELKLGELQPADKGQMELYLRWLAKHERQSGEAEPIGLILCAGKKRETVELLELEKSGIRVAEYWLELVPRKLLEKKLHQAIVTARGLIEARAQGEDMEGS
jgi:predicted nuclease of restriction endonuclease-like (RecB) superfamily